MKGVALTKHRSYRLTDRRTCGSKHYIPARSRVWHIKIQGGTYKLGNQYLKKKQNIKQSYHTFMRAKDRVLKGAVDSIQSEQYNAAQDLNAVRKICNFWHIIYSTSAL